MSEFIYELKDPFDYAHEGETVEASFVTLIEPGYQQLNHVVPIKQAFMSAITGLKVSDEDREKAAEDKDKAKDTDMKGDDVIQLFTQWNGDLTKVYKNAEKVFKAGGAQIDGQEKITQALLDKFSLKDFEALVGEYIANFIVPSLTDGQ